MKNVIVINWDIQFLKISNFILTKTLQCFICCQNNNNVLFGPVDHQDINLIIVLFEPASLLITWTKMELLHPLI